MTDTASAKLNATLDCFEDSGDELSGDSLGAAPFEEDSLEEEAAMDRRDEALWNYATLTERREESETDEEEELSDTMMQVMFHVRCVCRGGKTSGRGA